MSKREREELEVSLSKCRGSLAYATFGPEIKLQETNFAEAKYLAYAIFGLNPLKNPKNRSSERISPILVKYFWNVLKDCSSEDRISQGTSVVANLIY